MLHAQECAENVGIERRRVALCGLLCNWTGLAWSSRGVYSDIQATEARYGLIDQVSYIVVVANIGTPILGLSADLAKFSDQLVAYFVTSTRDHDARTLFREG
jgi:hypothetical protein